MFPRTRNNKEGEEESKKNDQRANDEAHYFGYLVVLLLHKIETDDNNVDDVEENDMLLDVRREHICCISDMDQRGTMCATMRIKYHVLLPRILIHQFQKVIIQKLVQTIQQHSTDNHLLLHQIPLIKKQ